MFLNVIPKKITSSINCNGENTSYSISLEVVSEEDNVFEIGENYVFTDENKFRIYYKEKEPVFFYLSISKSSVQDDKWLKERGFGSAKNGELRFYKGRNNSNDVDQTFPTLSGNVFLSDEQYNLFANHFLNKIKLSQINLEFFADDKDLSYGWEPDGSRQKWNFSDESKHPKLDIKSTNFYFEEKSLVEKIEIEEDLKLNEKDAYLKDLKEIKYILILISIPALGYILSLIR